MQAQEYLDEQIKTLTAFIKIRNEKMMALDSVFKEKGAKEQTDVQKMLSDGELSDEEVNNYHSLSMLSNDIQILSKKVADFIHFNKLSGIELSLENINKVNGFTEFLTAYKPYETSYILTPENQTKEANPELFNQHREVFKKTLRNKGLNELINEARN